MTDYAAQLRAHSLSDVEMSVRTHNVLQNAGYATLGDLQHATEKQIRALPNAGVKTWREVLELQEAFNIDAPKEKKQTARARHDAWLAAGGPAYPPSVNEAGEEGTDGMSLRDAFAMRAMQSLVAIEGGGNEVYIAANSYAMADAMLERRKIGVE
jgi:hypothetical protein